MGLAVSKTILLILHSRTREETKFHHKKRKAEAESEGQKPNTSRHLGIRRYTV
jgi:hypothetical protein